MNVASVASLRKPNPFFAISLRTTLSLCGIMQVTENLNAAQVSLIEARGVNTGK